MSSGRRRTGVERFDAVVVGAGPAGAATALRLKHRRPRLSVLLLDRSAFPRDKVCGDAVSAEAVAELDGLGVRAVLDGHPPVRRVRVRSVRGREVAGSPPGDAHVVPRRVLDRRLVEHAVAAGVQLRRHRVRAVRHVEAGVEVDGAFAAPVLVAADGANSRVRRLLGISRNPPGHTAVAVRGYAEAPHRAGELFLGWDAGGLAYAWSFPTGPTTVNAGFALSAERLTGGGGELRGALRRCLPDVDCDPGTLGVHHLPLSSRRPSPFLGRVLLVGDAASLINPLTGEGIFYALLSGRVAADAVVDGCAAAGPRYAARLRRALGAHLRHTAALARASRRPGAIDLLVDAAADPRVLRTAGEVAFGKGIVTPAVAARVAGGLLRRHHPSRL
jgi:geranylgeranyl reductase family protein